MSSLKRHRLKIYLVWIISADFSASAAVVFRTIETRLQVEIIYV